MNILVVDPEFIQTMSMSSLLGVNGHNVVTHCQGEAAANALLDGGFDLVIFEPRTEHFELQEALATLAQRGKKLPKLIVTTTSPKAEYGAGNNPKNIAAFFEKPFDDTKLLQAVKQVSRANSIPSKPAGGEHGI